MGKTEKPEEELNSFIHDLFLNTEYIYWRRRLKEYSPSRWHSLAVELSKLDIPIESLLRLGKSVYSKLVYNWIEAPDYRESEMLMIQFTVSGSMWHTLVWHCHERN